VKLREIFEDIEGEVMQQDRSGPGKLATQLLRSSQEKLYKEGKQVTPQAVKKMAEAGLNRFNSLVLQAMDNELRK